MTFDDFIKVKKRLLEEDGDVMTSEKYFQEETKFRLMDKDSSGSITWNDFFQYETANLIARKNKVILVFFDPFLYGFLFDFKIDSINLLF